MHFCAGIYIEEIYACLSVCLSVCHIESSYTIEWGEKMGEIYVQ